MKPFLKLPLFIAVTAILVSLEAGISAAQFSSTKLLIPKPVPTPQRNTDLIVAQLYFTQIDTIYDLLPQLDVWEVDPRGGYLLAAMDREKFNQLSQAGYRVTIDEEKTATLHLQPTLLPNQTSGIPGFPCYRTVEETYLDLENLAKDHPNLAQWKAIGESWERITPQGLPGYDIYALVLTNQSKTLSTPKPRFFLMGAIHAREYATAELATRFAEHLVENYGQDPDITWLLDYYEVHIVPIANPDGRKLAEAGYFQRKNTNNTNGGSCTVPPASGNQFGTDLNRNHSFNWGGASFEACSPTYQGPDAVSEPETQALETYLKALFPDQRDPGENDPAAPTSTGLVISLHSYSQLVLWPWGWTDQLAPNASELKAFGHKLAYFNHYTPQQSSALYPTTGDTTDFAYGELGLAAYTIELGTDFFQDCTTFEGTIYPDNLNALLYAFKGARLPYKNPSGPEALNISLSSTTVGPGSAITLTTRADDTRVFPGAPIETITAGRVSIDQPSWVGNPTAYVLQSIDGDLDFAIENLRGTIDTTGLSPGRHILFVESQDAAGHWGVPSAAFFWIGTPGPSIFLPFISK